VYHSYKSEVIDYGLGLDLGYRLRDNMWLSLGYNILGFDDADFRDARYTAQGPFLRFSIKADQHTLKNIAGQR
jgi:opacity protein-like surface antigen